MTEFDHITLDKWTAAVMVAHPTAQFTIEHGQDTTYGGIGDITAHTGPDMQADVVGVFTVTGYAWIE